MASLAKAISEFHRVTSGRHPGSPGQNVTSQVPHSAPPANRPHVRDDTMSTVNLDTREEGAASGDGKALAKVDTSHWHSGVDPKDFGAVSESPANPGTHMVQAERGALSQRKAGDGTPSTWYYFHFNPKTGEYGGTGNPDTDSRLHRDIFEKVVAPQLAAHPRHAGGLPIKYAGITNPNMAVAYGKPNPHFHSTPPEGKVIQLGKVDEIVPSRDRAAMEPESLTPRNRRDHKGGQWDSVTSYKLPGGWWHHAAEQKTSYGHPDNPMSYIHHTISSSSDPFDVDSITASMTGSKDKYGAQVDETAVDSQHRKQGHGRALYRYATMHHGSLDSGDSISRAVHRLYHSFLRDPQFDVSISDPGSEDRHNLTYKGQKMTPAKVWRPAVQKSDPLEKAMPRYVGEVDPEKEYVAVPHPHNARMPVWQHQPAKAKSFQSRIDQNLDRFSAQFGEHGPALKAGLQRVLSNKKHADLVPTALKPGEGHTPRRRHIAYLVSGDPAAAIKHIGNGEFIWRQNRHGEGGDHTWWKVNQHGVQDVTPQYENSSKDFFRKSDKTPEGDTNAQPHPTKDPHHERLGVLGSHGGDPRALSKSDDNRTTRSGVDDARPEGHSGQSRGASGSSGQAEGGGLLKATADIPPHGNETQGHWLTEPANHDGTPVGPQHVPHNLTIDQVSCVAVVDPVSGAILMGRRNDSGKWTNPGGHINLGETPFIAAGRELFEETGIRAKHLTYLGSMRVQGSDEKEKIIHCFLLLGKPDATGRNDPDQEVGQWYWINIRNNRLPDSVLSNLQNPRNVLFHLMGLNQ